MNKRSWARFVIRRVALGFAVFAGHAAALEDWPAAAETAVLFNPAFKGSAELAAYYAEKRGIPPGRVIGLACPVVNDITRAEFDETVRQPLRRVFEQNRWWPAARAGGTIRVLALMRGVPIRVKRALDPKEAGQEDEASVDSELMLLSLPEPPLAGFAANPYHQSQQRFGGFDSHPRLLLVGRLDGPDDATVKRLIDDALEAEKTGLSGRSVIDLALKDGPYELGENWLRECAKSHRLAGVPVYADRNAEVIPPAWPLPDTILYFGWYRDRASGALADADFRFARGAVACHLHSFSAAQLRSPDEYWAAPLLLRGATATLGNVWEPYLPLTCHLNLFSERLLQGWTLAEAAWSATPRLSWMQVVLGDPLYRPFARPPASRTGNDRHSEDYAFFRGLVTRQTEDAKPAELKKQLLSLAEERSSPRLLELLALHCWNTGDPAQAVELFDHAAAICDDKDERTRLRLYQAETLRHMGKMAEARKALETLPEHPAAKDLRSQLP